MTVFLTSSVVIFRCMSNVAEVTGLLLVLAKAQSLANAFTKRAQ